MEVHGSLIWFHANVLRYVRLPAFLLCYLMEPYVSTRVREYCPLVRGSLTISALRYLCSFDSSTIIQVIPTICNARQVITCYSYFDFRDVNKQHPLDPSQSTFCSFRPSL
jgi:hypothetical protein